MRVGVQALVAAACVAWAAATYLDGATDAAPGAPPPGTHTLLRCRPSQVQTVSVETPFYRHTAARVGEPDDRYFVFSSRRSQGDAGLPTGTDHVKRERFLANRAFSAYLTRLLPLRADRRMGVVDGTRAAEFGLEAPAGRFVIRCGGRILELELGGRGYGSGRRYVRRASDGEVFMLAGALIQDMQSARYKFKRVSPLSLPLSRVDRIDVMAGEIQRSFERDPATEVASGTWVPKTPEGGDRTRTAAVANWLQQLQDLRIRSYLAPEERPGADLPGPPTDVVAVVAVTYFADGRELERFEVTRVQRAGRSHYYGHSRATRGWVALVNSSAHRVAEDLALVLGVGGDRAPEPAADPRTPGLPATHPRLPGRYGGHGL